jgi:hypothetical protein
MSEQAASVSWEVVQKDIASQLRKFGSKDLGLSRGRLVLALVGLVSAGISFAGGGTWFAFIAAASAVGFIVLLSWHESVFRCLVLNRRKMAFIERSAKRVRTGVDSDGPEGVELVPADHPAAWDLNIFGKGSLFATICLAKTRGGQKTLSSWLLEPDSAAEIRRRAESVQELRPELLLRMERVSLSGDLPRGADLEACQRWGESQLPCIELWWIIAGGLVALLSWSSLVGWLMFGWLLSPFLLGVLLTGILYVACLSRLQIILGDISRHAETLRLLAGTIRVMGARTWKSDMLRHCLEDTGTNAESSLQELGGHVGRWNARLNQLFAPVAFLIFWDFLHARWIGAWHARHGVAIRGWALAVSRFEALDSLAHQAYLFPDAIFPTILDDGDASISGEGLAHPLINPERCVRNDVTVTTPIRCLLISGSNMSGKSTYMRTVGVNVVLALAGGAVHARRLAVSPMRVVATLQIQDSLAEGLSRFGAELARLRIVVNLSHQSPPLLFLIDEIFSGTNSGDRLAGAEALIEDLLRHGAIGMVTTHDLALTRIAENLRDRGANAHFIDRIEDGRMVFDYQLRAGIVCGSNARGLMRAIGIGVSENR